MRKYLFFSQWNPLSVQSNTVYKSNTFEYYAIKFVAELLIKDEYLLPIKFEIYKLFVTSLLEHKIQEDSELRVFLYEKFLNLDVEADTVNKLVAFEHVTSETKEILVEFAIQALENRTVIPENYIKNIDYLVQMLNLKRVKYSERLDKLDTLKTKSCESQADMLFPIKNPLGIFTSKKSNFDFKTSRSLENEKAKDVILKFTFLNKFVNNDELKLSLSELENQIEILDYRIVLVGDIKHGKSSLFNRLIGQDVSPVGEGTSTTSAVLELYYSKRPKYEVKWMSKINLNRILHYTDENQNNFHIWEYRFMLEELLEKKYFLPGSTISNIKLKTDLFSYVAVGEKYSPGVETVRIGYPVECLKHGAIIVDTPGLNDPMKVRDEITKQETRKAGTIVFVMRADKFGTEAERLMLNEIIQTGQVLELFIVLTHIDRISDDKERLRIFNEVREWLKKSLDNDIVNDVHIFAFDTRPNTSGKEEKEIIKDSGYQAFLQKLSNPLSEHKKNRQYVENIQKKRKNICELAKFECEKFVQQHMETAYNPEIIKNLNIIISNLEDMIKKYEEQSSNIIDNIKIKHKEDYEKLQFEIEQSKRLIMQDIKTAVEDKVRELNNEYDKKTNWNTFYSEIVTKITLFHTDILENKTQNILTNWEDLIFEFDEKISATLGDNEELLLDIKSQYETISNRHGVSFYVFCKADELFDDVYGKIKRVKTLGKSYIKSKGITKSAINMSVSNAINTSFPSDMRWKSFAFNLATIKSLFRDKDGQKEDFIKARTSEINDTMNENFDKFTDEIDMLFANFEKTIKFIIEKNYSPILNATRSNAIDLKNQIRISKRIQDDLRSYADKITENESLQNYLH